MGFLGKVFKGIGNAFGSIAKGIGNIAKGVMKFAQSPLGKLLIGVGLNVLTGGASGALSGILGGLGGGAGGGLTSMFGGFASKFLGSATSLLSQNGLGGMASFLGKAAGSNDLLGMVGDLMNARSNTAQPPVDSSVQSMANYNIGIMAAFQQATQLFQN